MKTRSGFVTILGRPNTGKSTLVNALVGSKISIVADKPQTTRAAIQGVVTLLQSEVDALDRAKASRGEKPLAPPKKQTGKPGGAPPSDKSSADPPAAQIIFLDTPGVQQPESRLDQQMMREVRSSLSERDLLLLVADASRAPGAADRAAIAMAKETGVPCLLLLNKIDVVNKQLLLPRIALYQTLHNFEEIIPISALKGDNLDLLRREILARLPEGPLYFPDDYLTDQPVRHLAGEIVREKIILATRQELPYSSAVVVDQFKEEPKLIRIAVSIYVEREGQKAIIIGKRGEMLKQVGTLARLELESILGGKVFLEMHVRVLEKWRNDPRFVRSLDWRHMASRDAEYEIESEKRKEETE
jgi:GTP-binding protein Era